MKLQKTIIPLFFCSLILAMPVYANSVNCYLQAVKNTCWQDRAVTLNLINISDLKTKQVFEIPLDKQGLSQAFDCKDLERFTFSAQFSPPLWEGEKKGTYVARKVWDVPKDLPPNTDKWQVKVCFSEDFSQVPEPIGAKQCRCEFTE